jgi:hypothetical protein
MDKYFHIHPDTGRVSEITEGEYYFRLRKHTTWGTDETACKQFLQPGFGVETRFGTVFAAENSGHLMEPSNGKA